MTEKEFRILFDKHYQGLLRFAYSYVDNIHLAENIVQDAFVLLWEKQEILEEDSNLYAFLIRVVKLKAWNQIEKQRRRITIEKSIFDDIVKELDLKLYTLDSINTTSIYVDEIEMILQQTLLLLPEQTRTIFNLSRKENLTNNEIAERMNLSVKSIEFHMTKALKQLRIALADYIKIILIIGNL